MEAVFGIEFGQTTILPGRWEEIDMLKARKLCVDDLFAAASNAGFLTAAYPGREPNPVEGGIKMVCRIGLTALCGAALVLLTACGSSSSSDGNMPSEPGAPVVSATTGNGQVTLSWPAVTGATTYNVYSSASAPVTTAGTKTNVTATGATLSALTNGTPVFAAVTAVNAVGESPLSSEVCAVPTAASTTGLTTR